jgi:Uma2 family endonuclease
MIAVMDMPQRRALVNADLDDRPDDGHRYELLDGVLIVTPAPSPRHQDAVAHLLMLLHAACPPGLKVMLAPLDVNLAEDTLLEPDVLVFRPEQADRRQVNGVLLGGRARRAAVADRVGAA